MVVNMIVLWAAYAMWTVLAHAATFVMAMAVVAFGESGGRETYRQMALVFMGASLAFVLMATFTKS